MAKALVGYIGLGHDVRMVEELRRLRGRVRELEAELQRVRRANAELVSRVTVDDLVAVDALDAPDREPALT